MRNRLLTFMMIMLACCQMVQAVPAYPFPFEVKQPDGTSITIQMMGDEHGYLMMTDDGYPVVQNQQTGTYEYATIAGQALSCSGIAVARRENRDTQALSYLKNIDVKAMIRLVESQWQRQANILRSPHRVLINDFPTIGTQRSLVILVEFSDVEFSSMDDPYEYYYNMLNQEGFTHENGANGSARDFYHDCSNGLFDPQFDVVGPVKLSMPQGYYGGDSNVLLDTMAYRMVIEACQLADPDVDFSQYDLNGDGVVDNIYFFYAGFGQADSGSGSAIWPHAGKLNEDWHQLMPQHDGVYVNRYATSNEIRFGTGPFFQPVGIGTFVHEFGHVLGLVDHYDTGYNGSFHPNTWDTMAAASYNDNQNTPPTFSAFERAELGWLSYTDIEPTTQGWLTVPELMSSNQAYRVNVPGTDGNEYFIMENRQQQGWDSTLPGHGMLVWHIDVDEEIWFSNQANADPSHQRIDIIEADKIQTINTYAADPFPGTGHVTSYDFYCWSHENLFSFDYVEETDSAVTFLLARTDYQPQKPQVHISDVMGTSFVLTWDEVTEAQGYLVTVEQEMVDGSLQIVGDWDKKQFDHQKVIQLSQLNPLSRYHVTVVSTVGSYESEPTVMMVETTAIQFAEMSPVAIAATDITATGFTAHWLPMDGATGYCVTVFSNEFSDLQTESYDFSQKADGMPADWETSSSQYSQMMYGESKPSLQFNNNDDYIYFSYPDANVVSLSFWQRSQVASNQLVVEQRDNDTEEWAAAATIAMSNKGEIVTIAIDTLAQARIRFERKSSYALIDDVEVRYINIFHNVVDGHDNLDAGSNTEMKISGLKPSTIYSYRVRGVQNGTLSAASNEVIVTLPDFQTVRGDVDGDGFVNISDVTALIDLLLGGENVFNEAADVDGDNIVNISDVTALIDKLLQGY